MTNLNLLSPLLDDAHDVEMLRRTLDMTSMDCLNHLLGYKDGVEELMMRSDHPDNTCNQIPKLPLHIGEAKAEAEAVVDFHVRQFVCYEILRDLCYCDLS